DYYCGSYRAGSTYFF
nr:immunoglobulin light chain junction region [Macaca mulatta]MOY16371.1 immunoglobulin light chain junction region [Macaca mulatta]MOY17031.1 immunoglobulin light chain junction region [Macaca mulatta]